ncbi:MAG: DEAD/DEAH box helicase [bacterium]|nr:DEAD/DEAH box helicase [Deltaproteobacteria bacterium]MCP4904603.1 DEAD/DEAH box helicase [bacterium]
MIELSELFADVAADIQQSIRDLGWQTPTPVQAAAIPKMRAGGDLIVQAMTGSGKTGAFGIPLVEAIDTSLKKTQAIVLLPTRELANQVAVELDQLGQYRGVNTLPIYGGVAYGPQLEGLEKGAHIIVGTPGRILDHLKNDRMDLGSTKVFVLDEADEMLSLGFWPDMKEIAAYLPRKRQSHLFSATMPEKVRSLSRFFLNDPEDVTIEAEGGPQQIEHFYYVCPAADKEAILARILKYEDPDSAIIFCNTKADVRFITAYLSKRGFNIDQISGDLQQSAREKAIKRIKSGKLRFLVATDVAARGIDISDLAYVINYTTSDTPEIYVHRTGRTGRAGKSGVAISLISGLDIGNFKFMQTVIGIEIQEKKPPTDRAVARRAEKRQKEEDARAAESEKEAELNSLKQKANADLAALPEEEAKARVERILPFVKTLAENTEGLEELARVAAAYLLKGPTETFEAEAPEPEDDQDLGPSVETRDEEIARLDREAGRDPADRPPRRRSRNGRGGGSGGGSRRRRG